MPFQRIVVAVDSGEPSVSAIDVGALLADRLRAKLTLVHAFRLPAVAYMTDAPLPYDEILAADHRDLEVALERARAVVPSADSVWTDGDRRTGILEAARDRGADLVIVGTRRRSGFSRAFLPSVAERIVRTSRVPVLTTHPRAASFTLRQILVPTDLGEPAARALSVALRLAATFGAKVTVLHAFDFPPGYQTSVPEELDTLRHRAEAALRRHLLAEGFPLDAISTLVVRSDPRHAILDLASARAADLVVMGTRHHRGGTRALLGSVTEQILRTCDVPVLTTGPAPLQLRRAPPRETSRS